MFFPNDSLPNLTLFTFSKIVHFPITFSLPFLASLSFLQMHNSHLNGVIGNVGLEMCIMLCRNGHRRLKLSYC